jgi:pimeloyl-ACP methyl ester carboxylesterase
MPHISLADWQAAGTYLSYREHMVFTRVAGDPSSPVLLLIHGFPTASWDWEALWGEVSQHYRVMTLDMMGYGFTAKPADYDYSLQDQANLYEHFLNLHDVHEYHIIAHDYGVSVAQELLARQRETGKRPKLQSICFLNGGLFPESHRPLLIQKLLLSPLGPLVARLSSKSQFSSSLRKVFGKQTQPDSETLDGFWQLFSGNHGTRLLPKLIKYIPERRVHRLRWVTAIQQSEIPLKLINGLVDPVSGAHLVKRYRALMPHPNVTELTQIGHYPQVEAPDAVLDAYREFRAGICARFTQQINNHPSENISYTQ